MIGSWDETNALIVMPFNAWSKGNGISDQNTGEMPCYPDGSFDAILTNMGVGYGYIYNAGNGYCSFDGGNDCIETTYNPTYTAASNETYEFKLNYNQVVDSQILLYQYEISPIRLMACSILAGGALFFQYYNNGINNRAISSTTITDGNSYTLHFIKEGANSLKIYINNVEVSYSQQDSYSCGTYTAGTMRLGKSDTGGPLASNIYWAALYTAALDNTRRTANTAADNAMGLVGNNTDDAMALSVPPSGSLLYSSGFTGLHGRHLCGVMKGGING